MKWAVLFLTINQVKKTPSSTKQCPVNHDHCQEVQQRCRDEVMDVLGEEKAAVADMPRMPYVLATIAEVGFCKIKYMTCYVENTSCSDLLYI